MRISDDNDPVSVLIHEFYVYKSYLAQYINLLKDEHMNRLGSKKYWKLIIWHTIILHRPLYKRGEIVFQWMIPVRINIYYNKSKVWKKLPVNHYSCLIAAKAATRIT